MELTAWQWLQGLLMLAGILAIIRVVGDYFHQWDKDYIAQRIAWMCDYMLFKATLTQSERNAIETIKNRHELALAHGKFVKEFTPDEEAERIITNEIYQKDQERLTKKFKEKTVGQNEKNKL